MTSREILPMRQPPQGLVDGLDGVYCLVAPRQVGKKKHRWSPWGFTGSVCVIPALSPQEAWPGGSSLWPSCAGSWDRCCWTMSPKPCVRWAGTVPGCPGPCGCCVTAGGELSLRQAWHLSPYQLPLIIPRGQAPLSLTHDLCLALAPAIHPPCWFGPLWQPVGGGTRCSATCVQNSQRGFRAPWWSRLQS